MRLVLVRVVGDVLAEPVRVLGARACFGAKMDHRRAALELRSHLQGLHLHRHVSDLERQVAKLLPEHQASLGAVTSFEDPHDDDEQQREAERDRQEDGVAPVEVPAQQRANEHAGR